LSAGRALGINDEIGVVRVLQGSHAISGRCLALGACTHPSDLHVAGERIYMYSARHDGYHQPLEVLS
jgi:hypothetical protein